MKDTIKKLADSHIDTTQMTLDSRFSFRCHKGLECFTQCCGKIDIFLTPCDVLKIKNRLGITSDEFLRRYAQLMDLKKTKIPMFMLKMTEEGRCPFVRDDGCVIYSDRPVVCRYYPIGLGLLKSTEVGGGDFYFPIREDFCKGYEEDREWTVREWRESQDINIYDFINKVWFDIVLNKKLLAPDFSPDEKSRSLFILCSYDIDGFRRFVFESRFLDVHDIDDDTVELIREDEVELLKFAHHWLRGALYGNPTIKRKS
jgi:Fe-S-cluster containining protein